MTIAAKTVQKLQLIRKKGYGLAPVSPMYDLSVKKEILPRSQIFWHFRRH